MIKSLTTKEVAKLLKLSTRRIRAKIVAGHFPNAYQCRACECWFIPVKDLKDVCDIKKIKVKAHAHS